VAGFCTLPQVYPSGQKWTAEDNKLYKPITKDIVDGVTHELTLQDILNKNPQNQQELKQAMLTGPLSMLRLQRHLANIIMYLFCSGNTN
jgi:hypothetical protein